MNHFFKDRAALIRGAFLKSRASFAHRTSYTHRTSFTRRTSLTLLPLLLAAGLAGCSTAAPGESAAPPASTAETKEERVISVVSETKHIPGPDAESVLSAEPVPGSHGEAGRSSSSAAGGAGAPAAAGSDSSAGGTDSSAAAAGSAGSATGGSSTAESSAAGHEAGPEHFTIAFAGDILLDTAYSAGVALTTNGASGCFGSEALRHMRGADLFIVNNEFPYTERGEAQKKQFTFRAKPGTASILKDMGADLVTLGNNHTYDYGETGLLDTLDALEKAGVPYIGAGRNAAEAERPAIYTPSGFKISILNAESILFLDSAPAQKAGENKPGTFDCYQPELLFRAVKKAAAESDFCIVIMHWGAEKMTKPNEKQLLLAKGAAEAGADLIVGAHPHVLQSIGYQGDVPVVYSLGNYLFHSGTEDTGLLEAVFSTSEKKLESLRFIPMQCRNFHVEVLSGSEKERLLNELRALSPGVSLSSDGLITRAQ